MTTRRQFLITAAALPLANCAGLTPAQVAQQVVTDVNLIASGLAGAMPGLKTAGISASVVTQVGKYVAQIQSLASSVSTSLTQTAAQPVIQQIGGVLSQILSIAGPMLPPPWGTAITAAEVLLPVVEAAVGLVVTSLKGPAAAAMTPDEARLILAGSTVK